MNRPQQNLTCCILMAEPLTVENGRAISFLEQLCACDQARPEFYGDSEPVRTPFNQSTFSLTEWRGFHLWRRKKPRSEGSYFSPSGRRHGQLAFTVEGVDLDVQSIRQLVHRLAAELDADFAYVHVELDDQANGIPYAFSYPMGLGLTTHDLNKGIPFLPWFSVFGGPYLDLLGPDRILLLGERSTQVDRRHVSVQLIPDPRAPTAIVDMEKSRLSAQHQIGAELFQYPSSGAPPRVPQWDLSGTFAP